MFAVADASLAGKILQTYELLGDSFYLDLTLDPHVAVPHPDAWCRALMRANIALLTRTFELRVMLDVPWTLVCIAAGIRFDIEFRFAQSVSLLGWNFASLRFCSWNLSI